MLFINLDYPLSCGRYGRCEYKSTVIRPVHTKDDKHDNKDVVLQIILNFKELQNPHHTYSDNGTEELCC